MASSLVPYGTSDDECDDANESKSSFTEDVNKTSDLESSPQPSVSHIPQKDSTSKSSSLSDIIFVDKTSKKITINLPSLEDLECDSDEEEYDLAPKKKIAPAGFSSLLSFLPKPKNISNFTSSSSLSTTSLVPHSVSRPKPKPIPNDASKIKPSISSKNTESSLNPSENEQESTSSSKSGSLIPEIDPTPTVEKNYNEILMEKLAEDAPVGSSQPIKSRKRLLPEDIDINDPAYKKYIAEKFGEEPPEQIHVVDIDVKKYLKNDTDYLKSISMERPEEIDTPAPNSTARRKHQITYLAYQAKQRELDLKNQAAANRLTKAQTRAKYGF